MQRKSYILAIFFVSALFPFALVYAAFEGHFQSAAVTAMSQAGCAQQLGANGIFLNPASLAACQHFSLSMFVSRPYSLPELTMGSVAVSLPQNWLALGIASQSYGNELYHELSFGLAAAKCIRPNFQMGCTVWYNNLAIKNYGSAHTLLIDLGARIQLGERLFWAASVFNFNRAQIGKDKEQLPQIIISGICLIPFSALQMTIDLYKDVRYPQELRLGIEFQPTRGIYLRAGTCTQPAFYSGGVGLDCHYFVLDYAISSHLDLGITHLLAITISRNH